MTNLELLKFVEHLDYIHHKWANMLACDIIHGRCEWLKNRITLKKVLKEKGIIGPELMREEEDAGCQVS